MGFLGNIFGSGPSLNTNGANTYLSTLGNIASNLGSQANAADAQYGTFNTNDVNALNSYSDYLKQNPATNQYNAQQTANAERGATEGANRATANFEQSLAQRGISPNSSIGVGGLARINQGLAENNAGIQAKIGEDNIDRHNANLGTLTNLWGGAANTAFGRGNALTSQEAGLTQDAFSDADRLAMEQYQADQAKQQQQNAFYGGLGNAVSSAFGGPPIFGGLTGGGSGTGAAATSGHTAAPDYSSTGGMPPEQWAAYQQMIKNSGVPAAYGP